MTQLTTSETLDWSSHIKCSFFLLFLLWSISKFTTSLFVLSHSFLSLLKSTTVSKLVCSLAYPINNTGVNSCSITHSPTCCNFLLQIFCPCDAFYRNFKMFCWKSSISLPNLANASTQNFQTLCRTFPKQQDYPFGDLTGAAETWLPNTEPTHRQFSVIFAQTNVLAFLRAFSLCFFMFTGSIFFQESAGSHLQCLFSTIHSQN